MTDGEFIVCRRVTGTEAGTAEAFTDDGTGFRDVMQRTVLEQLQVGRHAAGVHAHGERTVARAVAAQDICHGADIVEGAAGAAGNQALFDPDAAVMHLADQINLGTDNLLVCLLLALKENILRILQQFADGDGVARMHGQCNGGLNRGKINVHAAVIVGHIGRLHLLVRFRTSMDCEVFFRCRIGLPDGGPAGGLSGHNVDAVAVFNGQLAHAGADEFHDLVLHIAVGIDSAADLQCHVLRSNAGTGFTVEIDQDDAGTGHIIGASNQLLGQFASAFTH